MSLLDYCSIQKSLSIYGAGQKGKELYFAFKQVGINIKCFIISEIGNDETIDDVPVVNLDTWYMTSDNDDGIVVAVSRQYFDDIKDNLQKYNISNYYYEEDYEFVKQFRREKHPVDEKRFTHSVKPVSECFGGNRGKSICRYYIEKFLSKALRNIKNVSQVTEVGENLYSNMYFGETVNCDIIHYDKGTDLTKLNTLNKDQYDIFFCTQVLNFIYDVKSAIRGAYYLLKPGGTLLGSVAGNICPVSRTDMERYGHFWGFTYLGIEKLVKEVFGDENVEVIPFGNALAATAYTQGLCLEDIAIPELLDFNDENYAIVIGIIGHKQSD